MRNKLSSRHNRRKRREREKKDRPTKKSRVPIPSFTPIVEENLDESESEGNTVVPKVSCTVSTACLADETSTNTSSDATLTRLVDGAIKAPAFIIDHSRHGIRNAGIALQIDDVPALIKETSEETRKVLTKDGSHTAETKQGHTVRGVCQKTHEISTLSSAAETAVETRKNSSLVKENEQLILKNGKSNMKHDDERKMEAEKRLPTTNKARMSNSEAEITGDAPPKESVSVPDLSSKNEAESTISKNTSVFPLPRKDNNEQQFSVDLSENHFGSVAEKMSIHDPVASPTGDIRSLTLNDALVMTSRNAKPTMASLLDDGVPATSLKTGKGSIVPIPAMKSSSSASSGSSSPNDNTAMKFSAQNKKARTCKKIPKNRQPDGASSCVDTKKHKCSTNVGSANSGSSELIEIIEIGDSDDGDSRVMLTKKNKNDKVTSASEKNRKPNKSSHKVRVSISRYSSDSSSADEKTNDKRHSRKSQTLLKMKNSKRSKQSKKLLGNKPCFACSSCRCHLRAGTDSTPHKKSALTGSFACQERSLLNRLQRIERDITWKEKQRNDVFRELRKRRSQMVSRHMKGEGQSTNGESRFLAEDVETSGIIIGSHYDASLQAINHAQNVIFGKKQKSKFYRAILSFFCRI